ncbi:hypothetical protein PtB15_2B249 [Puccinia triticina]|nr:hypothetical protein PtB15_2B249 [Puccinia triticina]
MNITSQVTAGLIFLSLCSFFEQLVAPAILCSVCNVVSPTTHPSVLEKRSTRHEGG